MRDFRVVKQVQRDPFTFVELALDVSLPNGVKTVLSGFGMAKRNPIDPKIPAVGIEVATERAKAEIRERLRKITKNVKAAI